ncbi:MAG: polysaccharide deacetylase family protein [Candidatus Omnitrophica bacterium]|nr:polysaccharide deacetylase family protein [Candidatus Omnitrophota bacterium]
MRKNKFRFIVGFVVLAAAGACVWLFVQTAYIVPVLMYHSIDHNDKITKLSVSPESFARQMEFLHKHHYNVIPLEKAAPYIAKKERPPLKTIAITFDDGFENNYTEAYPVLKKYNIPATIFVIIEKIGSPGFLNWAQIKEMSDSGIITIGSHTKTHFWLLESKDSFLKSEVADSKDIIEGKIGKKVNVFCYPMGSFDSRSKKAVEDAGYVCAVATSPLKANPEDVFTIRRAKISRSSDNLLVFWGEISRLYTWFKRQGTETE